MRHPDYKVLTRLNIEDVLPHVVFDNTNARHTITVSGREYQPKIGTPRLKLFATKGTRCVCCGLQAEGFYLQFNRNQEAKQPHLGLWGRSDSGKWKLLTIDHIIPKARGGKNRLYNYQVMCQTCNAQKGSD